ncbi:MAG: hypothetical protein CVU57_25085 [Deltaproteobacteria bacterium HGW-Deltaproteobacteria-15]|nr:MAG: hypothetical protein CVU57_25085 [Deltaproteobacteria bacterium HGW-Deltaproteobacteria-15]
MGDLLQFTGEPAVITVKQKDSGVGVYVSSSQNMCGKIIILMLFILPMRHAPCCTLRCLCATRVVLPALLPKIQGKPY